LPAGQQVKGLASPFYDEKVQGYKSKIKSLRQKLNHSGKKGKATSYKGWIATTNFLMATVVR
jgi:hypothetical protein